MQGNLDHPPILVRGSRARPVWLVLGSAVFVAIGLVILASGKSPGVSLLTIGFFGLCGAAGVAILIAPPRLEIGPSGITQKVLLRTVRFAWTDIYNFRPIVLGLSSTTVGFDYLTERPSRTGLRALNTAVAGAQGALNPGMELRPAKLAELLNEARERWIDGAAGAPAAVTASPAPAPSSSLSLAALAAPRIDRKAYWIATAAIFAIAVALSFVPGVQRGTGSVTSVLFIRIFAGRLHDLGRSGWWQVLVYALEILAAVAGALTHAPVALVLGIVGLIHIAFVVALGLVPGQRGANRFGPPPNQPSPVAVAEAFR